jgi:hypothetical protein
MGSVNLDNTGSGSAVTLSSDGTDLLLDGTAIGGGGGDPDLYRDNASSATTPSATGTNAVAIGSGATATQRNSFSMGGLADATAVESVAIGYNSTTSGSGNSVAIGMGANTSGWYASSFGFSAQATGSEALAFSKSRASGSNSLAAAISSTSTSYGATGASSVAIGYQAKATGSYSQALGFQAQATNTHSIAIGRGTNSSGVAGSVAIGYYADADGRTSLALGYRSKSRMIGELAFASNSISGDNGVTQTAIRVLISDTTDATAEALTTNNSTASTDNQVILPNNSAYSFSGTIIAREQASAGSDYASWEIKGALLRDANAASTVLGNGIQNKMYATSGASAWAIALTADTTNGGLKIEVTGAASTNIRWVATVNTSEVTY